jgi:hypothetical protein
MAYGFSGILIPLWIAPILLVISGCLSLYLKSKTPIAGTAIGIGLYFPLMVASLIVGAIAMSIIDLPSQSGVFILPIGLLIWAFMRNPKDNQERFPQHPPPPPRSPAERSKGEG